MAVDVQRFTGFRPEAIDFLVELAQNNDRDLVPAAQVGVRGALEGPDGGDGRRPGRGIRRAGPAAQGRSQALDL